MLAAQGLTRPEDVFSITKFKENPKPFNTLAVSLWPGQHKPTASHRFVRQLEKRGKLLRCVRVSVCVCVCVCVV